MHSFRHPWRRTPLHAAISAIHLAIMTVWVLLAAPAGAACLANPDPQIRPLQTLVEKDATRALEQVRSRLQNLGEAATGTGRDAATVAALYAVQAQAYTLLELSAEATTAAAEGLKLATDVHDVVHLELVLALAENAYDATAISGALDAIETARTAQRPGSTADNCLLITRGLLENREDRADLAVGTLTQAYRATASPPGNEPHILSAANLSIVMRAMGDYAQALDLNQEEIAWDAAHGATLNLSVARFMRGRILRLMGNQAAAIAEFEQARKLSMQLADDQGVAFADLRICEAHVELGDYAPAMQECGNALRVFSASHAADSVKETLALFARMDLLQGRPQSALAALNDVLDQGGADLPPQHVAPLYDSRAAANAALHHYRAAYDDLREYLRRYTAANDAERQRQGAALRARFATDREIERNASLQRELSVSQRQSSRQARELRVNALVVFAGFCVIALLTYFLVANLRYRQQLLRLASLDGLTGLPNRRRIAELATAAMQTASSLAQPLTIALIDLDHFKAINDSCGHATGDHVLKEFARAGGEALRDVDALGRWGGEEFLLVMPGATLEVAVANLERLRTLICGIRLPASGAGLRVSLSAGLAEYAANNTRSLDELIARADGALYQAKHDGRDLIRIADARFVTGSHAIRRAQRQ
jgi:diguanylate cyclase (GGDEF)-like protein